MAEDLLARLILILGLLGICVVGYILALKDFRPKGAQRPEEKSYEKNGSGAPDRQQKELTLSQLGIADLADTGLLSPEEQRRLKMEGKVRQLGQAKPQDVAVVVRKWLGD